jgi:hypothetical protein
MYKNLLLPFLFLTKCFLCFGQSADNPTEVFYPNGKLRYAEYDAGGFAPGHERFRVHYIYRDTLVIEKRYTDVKDNLLQAIICESPITRYTYDDWGRKISEICFKEDTVPWMHDCGHWHRIDHGYNPNGKKIREAAYTLTGKMLHLVHVVYNENGDILKVKYFDGDSLDIESDTMLYDKEGVFLEKINRKVRPRKSGFGQYETTDFYFLEVIRRYGPDSDLQSCTVRLKDR